MELYSLVLVWLVCILLPLPLWLWWSFSGQFNSKFYYMYGTFTSQYFWFRFKFEFWSWFFEHWGQSSYLSRTRSLFSRAKVDAVFYTHNHNIDLRTSMNERTHFFIKIYLSHFILKRVGIFVVCERGLLLSISSSGSQGVPKIVRAASNRLRVPRSTVILCTLPKTDRVFLITWSPSGYTPVRPECPDAPSSSCLLIKIWQLTKALRVTRNGPKIHSICYITAVWTSNYTQIYIYIYNAWSFWLCFTQSYS